jgi:hypothetical protein
MGDRFYFLLTSLPELPELGGPPPIDPSALRERARGVAAEVLDAIYLERDLLAREAALAGEVHPPRPLVLTTDQIRGEADLPGHLGGGESESPYRLSADEMWDAYFRHAAAEGRRLGCRFLIEWAGFEVALRNALVVRRGQLLQLDPTDYQVARDIEVEDPLVESAVNAWVSADDPFAAQQALDRVRWKWCEHHSRYFSFAIDEVGAYARRLLLVARWQKVAREEETADAE